MDIPKCVSCGAVIYEGKALETYQSIADIEDLKICDDCYDEIANQLNDIADKHTVEGLENAIYWWKEEM